MQARKHPKHARQRRGAIAVLIAILLPIILGFLAITLEGGALRDTRRRAQNAADAAARAAATELFTNYPDIVYSDYHNADPGGAGAAAARASAADNGFAHGSACDVEVNLPPDSGPFKHQTGYAEVIITYQQPRYLSAVWGGSTVSVVARAVARARWVGANIGIMVLDPDVKNALVGTGNGDLTVTGGSDGTVGAAVIVNSSDYVAAAATGGGALIAPQFKITGDYDGTLIGDIETGVPPSPDPLRNLPEPVVTEPGTITSMTIGPGQKLYRLTPGYYSKLPNFTSGDVIVLEQGGIYSINSGGFKSTGATIMMDPHTSGGVMLYNNPNGSAVSDVIAITGNSDGTVNLSALTDGPYAGILFWQKRSATQTLSVSGGGSFNLSGTLYAANAQLSVTGNGTAVIGSQYISRTLALGGGGTTLINYSDEGTARIREVILVE